MTYAEKLQDVRWQKKRLHLLELAGWKCQANSCSNSNDQAMLEIHHKLYLRKTMLWDYPDWCFEVLCRQCHEFRQGCMERAHACLAKNWNLMLACSQLSLHEEEFQSEVTLQIINQIRDADGMPALPSVPSVPSVLSTHTHTERSLTSEDSLGKSET